MNQNTQTINQMRAITISREYGSAGGEIATRLARHLKWQLIDHEIVERVAAETGTSLVAAEAHDERTEGILARIFNNLQSLQPAYKKAKQLSSKTDELGPAVGLPPYPDKPADFHPKAG